MRLHPTSGRGRPLWAAGIQFLHPKRPDRESLAERPAQHLGAISPQNPRFLLENIYIDNWHRRSPCLWGYSMQQLGQRSPCRESKKSCILSDTGSLSLPTWISASRLSSTSMSLAWLPLKYPRGERVKFWFRKACELTWFSPRICRIFPSGNIRPNLGKIRLFGPYDRTIGSGRSASYGDGCVRDRGQLE